MISLLRVLIADDDPSVREALQLLLLSQPHIDVVGELVDSTDLAQELRRLRVDVLLLDCDLPELDQALLQALRHECPSTRIIVMSASLLQPGLPDSLFETVVSKMDGPDGILDALLALVPQDL